MTNRFSGKKVISRVSFCPRCYDRDRPSDGDMFTVYGSQHHCLHYFMFQAPLKRADAPFIGFVPHFFMIDKIEGEKITVIKCCGMENCGVFWTKDAAGGRNEFQIIQAEEIIMTPRQWIALVNFADSGYKI